MESDSENNNDKETAVPSSKMPIFRIFLLTFSMMACVISWSAQIGYATPFLRQLGMQTKYVGYVWIAGPLSGIIVQSVVGYLSDKIYIKNFGRRRPFMLLGAFCTSVCLILFSNCDWLADLIFHETEKWKFIIGVPTFFCIGFSINIMQVSIRALLADIVPSSQQTIANVFITLMYGLGNLIGFGVGSIDFVSILPYWENQVRPVFFIAMNVACFAILVTCSTTREENKIEKKDVHLETILEEKTLKLHQKICNSVKNFFISIKKVPSAFWTAWICQFLCFGGKITQYIYMADYVGKQVFGGDPMAPKGSKLYKSYAAGVRLANLGFTTLALTNCIYSFVLQALTNFVPLRVLWFTAQLIQGISLFACPFVPSNTFGKCIIFVIFFGLGIVETNLNSVPWAVIFTAIRESDLKESKGILTAVFNWGQCIPQFAIASLGELLVSLIEKWGLPAGSILAVGGISGFASAICVLFAVIPKELQGDKCIGKCQERVKMEIKRKKEKKEGIINYEEDENSNLVI